MAGNSQRKGAKRKPGSKKGAVVGTGGAKSKGLRPKGPTPRADERTKAAKRARPTERTASAAGGTAGARPEERSPRPQTSASGPAGDGSRADRPARGTGQTPRRAAGTRTSTPRSPAATRGAAAGAAPRAATNRGAAPSPAGRGSSSRGAAPRGARGSAPRAGGARTTRPGPRKGTGKEGSETVVGRNSVVEALRAGVPATALYVAERIDADDRVREAIKLAADRGLPLLESPRAELDRITSGAVHQGLGLQVPPYVYAHADDLVARATDAGQVPLIVALDGVTDPRNLGAIVRSAAAFGAHGVVVPDRRSAGMTAGAWKASAGAAARVPVARVTNLTRQLEAYRRAGFVVAGLAADGLVDAADLEASVDPLVLVVGSEDQGLSRLVERSCDVLVTIPMAAGNESLNAGVAAGIVLYEVARHRATAADRDDPALGR
jgi:23S rRNA (guanosine2251-2'-O)-methyltransferase